MNLAIIQILFLEVNLINIKKTLIVIHIDIIIIQEILIKHLQLIHIQNIKVNTRIHLIITLHHHLVKKIEMFNHIE